MDSPADDSPAPEDADPLKASLALASQTTSELLISPLTAQSFVPNWPALTVSALPPGTTVKILYHQDDLHDDPVLAAFAHRISSSVLVRATCSRLPDMVISDRQSAIVFASSEALAADSLQTEQPDAISILTVLFDQAWDTATPLAPNLEPHAPKGRRELLEPELKLLKLLAAGVTDETAARHLGVSLRTARRHMATLMSRLAATSRFQAGVEAVKRGWIT